ncbi:uncharacterized protein NDAI_0C04140 [Naumovozyma dairenensis CBS 421]|uniref:Uncharacterized protein n=1 Tax=Naumovozyma dairenensis (strain ATCC 10597 / BCRC 20456 / CBS 421 / NBRC 0211 / NRRL Y-12639) TaxID=1071378 RepID=G0W8G3_NAUDC|nr:hypothetical protein NDAI_0C04140 [Naumovozyma dairenensis CBS 421]CCD24074.1 hypothetical protein NDAI_0C04140 [Naumovozyma dairenensis CBS 421]
MLSADVDKVLSLELPSSTELDWSPLALLEEKKRDLNMKIKELLSTIHERQFQSFDDYFLMHYHKYELTANTEPCVDETSVVEEDEHKNPMMIDTSDLQKNRVTAGLSMDSIIPDMVQRRSAKSIVKDNEEISGKIRKLKHIPSLPSVVVPKIRKPYRISDTLLPGNAKSKLEHDTTLLYPINNPVSLEEVFSNDKIKLLLSKFP